MSEKLPKKEGIPSEVRSWSDFVGGRPLSNMTSDYPCIGMVHMDRKRLPWRGWRKKYIPNLRG
jgi:hypothetical protein